jgi:hypothetical protein
LNKKYLYFTKPHRKQNQHFQEKLSITKALEVTLEQRPTSVTVPSHFIITYARAMIREADFCL